MKCVLITGGSGNMGKDTVRQIAETGMFVCRLLLRDKPRNRRLGKKLKRQYKNIEIIFGDTSEYPDCVAAIKDVDYVLHLAGIIPPAADHYPEAAYNSNYTGTVNLLNAAATSTQKEEIKFINIGSVAEYGNRSFKHPWGRIGDPLLPSIYDTYGAAKIKAERAVIESAVTWVSLRQTGLLYPDVLIKNLDDGLMFHTAWNTPIEWATERMSGLLLKNLLVKDSSGALPHDFWRRAYNIGNGPAARTTGFETLARGFRLMGADAKSVFEPHWNATQNFHCMWFSDSHVLNEYLDFWHEGFEDFFSRIGKKFWYFKLAKPFTALIKKFMIMPLLDTSNAPQYWGKKNRSKRVAAFFGSQEKYDALEKTWEKTNLLCENKNPDTGDYLNYAALKDESQSAPYALKHGYNESKADNELDITDMQDAAAFRGGTCTSTSMRCGDLYTPLNWQCHNGHDFSGSPYLILKAGHWCPECCSVPPWNFDELAAHIPFYAQVWHDDHAPSARAIYKEDNIREY